MARKRRSLWFVNGEACPKCGNVHDPTRCSGHRKSDGRPCQNRHAPGAVSCTRVHGSSTKAAKAAAKQRVMETEIRGFLATKGRLDGPDYLDMLEEELQWKYFEVNRVREAVQQQSLQELIWGKTEHSKKKGGEDWGIRNVEKAGMSALLTYLHKCESELRVLMKMCDDAGMTQKRKEYLERVGSTVSLSMKAMLGYIVAFIAEQRADEDLVYRLEAAGPELMTRALLTLDPSQQLPGGN